MIDVAGFVVRESVQAITSRATRHAMKRFAAIEEMIREEEAKPGEFSIREINDAAHTVRVFWSGGLRGTGDVAGSRT